MSRTVPGYHLSEELPGFGPGSWHRAEQEETGRAVAVGFLVRPVSDVHTEPGFVTVLESGPLQEGAYMVTALRPGATLESRLARGRIPVSEALAVARRIAEILETLHRQGKIYGGLAPSTVRLTPAGEVELFPRLEGLEQAGSYRAPEGGAGASSDIWALGVLLYEMMAGQPPFASADAAELAYAARFEQPPPLRSLRRGVPPGAERVIQLAMAKRAEHRYQRAADFRTDIESVSAGRAPAVANPHRVALAGHRTQRGRARRKMPGLTRASLVALLVLAAVGAAYIITEGVPFLPGSGRAPVAVAIVPFHDLTYRSEAESWPFLVQRTIAGNLERISVVDPDSLNALIRERVGTAQARRGRWLFELLEERGIPYLIDGGVFVDGERYLLRGQVIQRWSAEVLMADTAGFRGAGDLEAAARRLAASMQSFLLADTLSQ